MISKTTDRVIAGLALAAIGGAVIVGQFDLVPRGPICPSVILFGRECAGCGLTRSFAALGRGDVDAANLFNPMGPILFAWAVVLVAIRVGKRFAPRFRYWGELDLACAIVVVLAFLTRGVLFYLG